MFAISLKDYLLNWLGSVFTHPRNAQAAPRTRRPSVFAAEARRIVRQIKTVSRFMDGTDNMPLGIDPLVGLIPVVGDIVNASVGGWTIWQAKKLGYGPVTLFKMTTNVVLDMLVGMIPVIGDLVDLAFRAHRRNLDLLGIDPESADDTPPPIRV